MAAIPQKSVRNLAIIYAAAWMRSFGIGLLGVVLGVFLYREGFSSTAIGLVIAAGLAGAATGTVFITFKADRLGRRRTLFVLSLLTAAGSLPLIFYFGLPAMIVIAFLGMLNGMGTDRSPAFALEQATIPGLVADEKRTWALAWYSVVLDASGAVGALAAGIPIAAQRWWGADLGHSYRLLFIAYAGISVLTALLYLLLSPEVEIRKAGLPLEPRVAISPETRSTIKRLSALFAIDAFGGGFLTDALVSYWFFRRFWHCGKPARIAIFHGTCVECALTFGSGVAGATDWLDQDNGIYSFAVERVSDCNRVHAVAAMGNPAISAAGIAGGNGCTDATVLCRRSGEA